MGTYTPDLRGQEFVMGEAFDRRQLTSLVCGCLIESQVGKMGGCHLFRHTVANLMLEDGADIRAIQQMVGQAKFTTTELYTRVSISLLRQGYSATHPATHLKRPETPASTPRDAAAEAEKPPVGLVECRRVRRFRPDGCVRRGYVHRRWTCCGCLPRWPNATSARTPWGTANTSRSSAPPGGRPRPSHFRPPKPARGGETL